VAEPIWVIDTSSVIQIRRLPSLEDRQRKEIYESLSARVTAGTLVYPKEVLAELERNKTSKTPDLPYEWAKKNEKQGCRFGPLFAELREVLARPQINRVFDPDKTTGAEEADPYVLALAYHLKGQGMDVTVITEESRARPDKLPLSTACSLLRIISLPVEPFLREQGLWPS
jgi:uncharacterized protein DUF4411